MITMSQGARPGKVAVVFAVPDCGRPVAVVGSFNNWDPYASPLRRRSNGTRSCTIEVDDGDLVTFRYLIDGHAWADDPDADQIPDNLGGTHCAVVARAPLPRRRPRPR